MPGDPAPVAVVTDSTACLPAHLAGPAGLLIVPLTVLIGDTELPEGTAQGEDLLVPEHPAGRTAASGAGGAIENAAGAAPAGDTANGGPAAAGAGGPVATPMEVAHALRAGRGARVRTSQPAPARFSAAYRQAFERGATGVVSVHLSGRLSGTCEAARLAARAFAGRVTVVDSGLTGMGLGFAALAAARAAAGGADPAGVRDAAVSAARRTTVLFYVDTLEYLRRGGRIGTGRALLGTALSVRPILHMVEGEIAMLDKVRTSNRALARLVDLAVEAAGGSQVDIAVHHLDALERARSSALRLRDRLGTRVGSCTLTEVGAVVAAHAGPGLVSVVVHRRT